MRISSMMSIPYGSSSMMQLRALESGYARACDKALESADVIHLEDMSHSQRMEFLKHDGALRQLQQDKERADLAKAEVTRVLDRVRSIRKDIQGIYKLQLKIERGPKPLDPKNLKDPIVSKLNFAKEFLDKQTKEVVNRIEDIVDSIRVSSFYNGSSEPIKIRPGYTVSPMDYSKFSLLKSLKHQGLAQQALEHLDLVIIPHLSQDLETCDRAHEVIDAEIKMHKSIISKFYVSQDVRKLQRADAKYRLDSFLMFLWDQMRWSREMMKMMHGMS